MGREGGRVHENIGWKRKSPTATSAVVFALSPSRPLSYSLLHRPSSQYQHTEEKKPSPSTSTLTLFSSILLSLYILFLFRQEAHTQSRLIEISPSLSHIVRLPILF